MRLAFLGLPLAGLALAREGHEIVLCGLCRAGAPGQRRLVRALGDRVLVKPRLDRAFVARAKAAAPELLVSWFWTNKIPPSLVAVAPRGGVGFHPSLLPRWRGPDPCGAAILAGDAETGVTAHRIAAEYDTGAILAQRRVPIAPHWDAWALARALDGPSLALMVETVAAFARGAVTETPQDEARVTLAQSPTEEELELDFRADVATIARRVRAAAPYPGAWTFLGDEAVVVTRVEPAPDVPRVLEPGEAAVVRGRVVVRAADGGVALLRGRRVTDDGEAWCDAAALAALL